MKAPKTLDTLIERSRDARDQAGRALADDRRVQQQTAQQLSALQQYRQEYNAKLHAALMAGMDVAALNNYQRFMQSLDTAIGNADLKLQQNNSRVDTSQQHWRARQKQLSSFDTLAHRRAARERVRDARQEQRRTDEASNNTQARKLSRDP